MDRREIAALLAYIGCLDPRTTHTDTGTALDRIAQWHELLHDVPATTAHGWDAREAVRAHTVASPYPVLPVDVARKWAAYRRDRLERHTDPTPNADPDDPAAWRSELLGTRHAVAVGQAAPSTLRQLTAGPHPDLEARLRSVGSVIPPAARAQLARYRPARAAREAATAAGQPDALSVPCPWCHAHEGVPCRNRRTGLDGGARGNAPRAIPHPSRVDLAASSRTRQMAVPRPATVPGGTSTRRTGPARSAGR
ncbi:hypothetical protein AB0O18_09400 [Streptomyces sp. NPDC093224]|uniref:zinc finger domain-containing protein n=1 Tax=Streptomyces sp. NPDC093224 TaxID=3155198 RepID=UPI00341B46A5